MDLTDLQLRTGGTSLELGGGPGWQELLGQLGREAAAPLTAALERINAFASSGSIDRTSLRALRDEIDRARRIGVIGQQISRFASGRIGQTPERQNLTQVLREALAQRARETAARGIDLRQELGAAEVMADALMLRALLQSLIDWSFEHARSHIEFRLDLKPWPEHARLTCRFAHVPADEVQTAADKAALARKLETMAWQLLRHLAQVMGLVLQRQDGAGDTRLTLEFPRTVGKALAGRSLLNFDEPATGPNSQPLAGRHVLVIAARRETRNAVRECVRSMGLMVDYVASLEQAREFCSNSLPQAVVYESALAGAPFRALRDEWTAALPSLGFVEIGEQGPAFEISDLGGAKSSRIALDAIMSALPNALMFELGKQG